jgi:Spy/CpxP family protein refolding chaperone
MSGLPRSVLTVLAISLALNLFFIGAWTGRHFSGRGPHDQHGETLRARDFIHRSGLDDADPAVHDIIHAQRQRLHEQTRALAEARTAVREALENEPFDPAKLDRALTSVETRNNELQRAMHAALSEVARAVKPDQRRKMANALWPKPGPRGRAR